MKLADHILRWVGVFLMVLTLGALLSPVAPPRPFWPFSIIGLFFPALAAGLLLLVFYWALRRQWRFLLPLLFLMLGWSQIRSLLGLRLSRPEPLEAPLRVMTYNLQNLWELRKGSRMKEEFREFFREQAPDVLCLQEASVNSDRGRRLDTFLRKELHLGHRFVSPLNSSLAIYSRFPIEATHGLNFENNSNGFLYADLEVGGRLLRIYNVHLQSNQVSQTAGRVMNEGNLQEKETWLDIRSMLGRYKRAAQQRTKQADLIAGHVRKCEYPVILCGDLNDTPLSYAYHLLSEELHDGFRQAGRGLGQTYRGGIPGLRIDYIFFADRLPPVDYRTHCLDLSDHCAVTATFSMAAE